MVMRAAQLRPIASQQSLQQGMRGFSKHRLGKNLEIPEEPEKGEPFASAQFDATEAIGRLDMQYAAAKFFQVHTPSAVAGSAVPIAFPSPNFEPEKSGDLFQEHGILHAQ